MTANTQENSKKLTKLEKSWVLYDVGNSAFTMLVSTIFQIYFTSLTSAAGVDSTDSVAYWGYVMSAATLLVAVLGPILGTMADGKGKKKPIFVGTIIVGVGGLLALTLAKSWIVFVAIFLAARVGYSLSLIIYDAMLTDVTTDERMDTVSSYGYAWGYIGSCVPFILSLVLILKADTFGLGTVTAMNIAFAINAAWWFGCTVPLLKEYKQIHYVENHESGGDSMKRLGQVFGELKQNKKATTFLISFFFYIDGVYTIIDMATVYGQSVGLGTTDLLLALLLTQFVAFPCALLLNRLSSKYTPDKIIPVCIIAYFGIAIFALFLAHAWQFWMLATFVGVFQGAIQALSRSYFGKIIPKEKSGEYFGVYDIFGKGAAFLGTTLMGLATQIFNSSRAGVVIIALMFLIGLIFFKKQEKIPVSNN